MVFLDLIDFSSTLIPFFVFRLERALAAVLYFNYCCLLREDRHRETMKASLLLACIISQLCGYHNQHLKV